MDLNYYIERYAEQCRQYSDFLEGLVEPDVDESQEQELFEREQAGEFWYC